MSEHQVHLNTAAALPPPVLHLCKVTDGMWLIETTPCFKPRSTYESSFGLTDNGAKAHLACCLPVPTTMHNSSDPAVQKRSQKEHKTDGDTLSDVLEIWCHMEKKCNGNSPTAGKMKDRLWASNDINVGRVNGPETFKVPNTSLNSNPSRSEATQSMQHAMKPVGRVRFDEDSIRRTSTSLDSLDSKGSLSSDTSL